MYKTRYAPSPTGEMHLGHARTALITWLRARSEDGRIVMRIEDLDPPRVREGSEQSILKDHEWLGLDWDEGPFRQSERYARYERAIERLGKTVFPCSCTRKEIRAASAPHAEDQQGLYPGTCYEGPTKEGRPTAIRFRMPRPSDAFVDGLMGHIKSGLGEDDFVVKRSDGLYAYQLALVVDDAEMGVTEVIRADDLLSSTPRQIALYKALGYELPAWIHLPLVNGQDGRRLAKRHGAVSVSAYKDAGWSKERLYGALAFSLGLTTTEDAVSLQELLGTFSLSALKTNGHQVLPSP